MVLLFSTNRCDGLMLCIGCRTDNAIVMLIRLLVLGISVQQQYWVSSTGAIVYGIYRLVQYLVCFA
jgi:hypothetical protein